MSGSLTKPRDWYLLMACYQIAKFGGHMYCSSRDMFLACHVIKQDNLTKGSSTLWVEATYSKSSSYQVWWP